jgi:hypothetical protein
MKRMTLTSDELLSLSFTSSKKRQLMLTFHLKKHAARLFTTSIWLAFWSFIFVLSVYGSIVKFKWEYLLVLAASLIGVGYYGFYALGFISEKATSISFWFKNDRLHWNIADKQGNQLFENSIDFEKAAYIEIIEYRRKMQRDCYLHLLDAQKKTLREQDFHNEFYQLAEEDWREVLVLVFNHVDHIQVIE